MTRDQFSDEHYYDDADDIEVQEFLAKKHRKEKELAKKKRQQEQQKQINEKSGSTLINNQMPTVQRIECFRAPCPGDGFGYPHNGSYDEPEVQGALDSLKDLAQELKSAKHFAQLLAQKYKELQGDKDFTMIEKKALELTRSFFEEYAAKHPGSSAVKLAEEFEEWLSEHYSLLQDATNLYSILKELRTILQIKSTAETQTAVPQVQIENEIIYS